MSCNNKADTSSLASSIFTHFFFFFREIKLPSSAVRNVGFPPKLPPPELQIFAVEKHQSSKMVLGSALELPHEIQLWMTIDLMNDRCSVWSRLLETTRHTESAWFNPFLLLTFHSILLLDASEGGCARHLCDRRVEARRCSSNTRGRLSKSHYRRGGAAAWIILHPPLNTAARPSLTSLTSLLLLSSYFFQIFCACAGVFSALRLLPILILFCFHLIPVGFLLHAIHQLTFVIFTWIVTRAAQYIGFFLFCFF